MYNSMKYILENDPEPLCLSFSINKEVLGEVISNGYFENFTPLLDKY